jgi:hypothetical protein
MIKVVNFRLSEDLNYKLKLKTTKEKTSIQALLEKFVKNYVIELDEKTKK